MSVEVSQILVEGEITLTERFFDEVSVSQILVEGEIQQDERFDEEVSFSQILVEGEPSGGFAQIIMLQN